MTNITKNGVRQTALKGDGNHTKAVETPRVDGFQSLAGILDASVSPEATKGAGTASMYARIEENRAKRRKLIEA